MGMHWKLKINHYIIMSGNTVKLSESCIASGVCEAEAKAWICELFDIHVNETVANLRKDKNIIDVTRLDVTSMNTTITFDGLNGMHVLEYYISLE